MARPTKLDPQVQDFIIKAIRLGNYAEVAAVAAGIAESTFYRWMERGEQAKSGPFREFWEAVTRAKAEAEVRDVTIIAQAASEDWRAAAFRLERRSPERWSRREKVTNEHVGKDGGPIEIMDARERIVSRLSILASRAREDRPS